MSYALDDDIVLSRVPEGPLAAYLAPFAESLKQQGYTPRYLHRAVIALWLGHESEAWRLRK